MSEKTPSNEEVGQALADGLGLETAGPQTTRAVDEFFESVAQASTDELLPEQPSSDNVSVAPAEKFVHEPTGKEFGSEIEYLRYNSGWTAQQMGEKNKALELQMAELKGQVEAGNQPQKVQTKMDLKRQLWPNASEESLNDYASDFILEGVENAVGILMQSNQAELAKRDALISQLGGRLEETAAYSNSGVDPAVEQRLAQKYSDQKAKLSPAEWIAMVKDFGGAAPAQAGPGKLLDNISAAGNPADHVEGSALSTPQSSDEALIDEFDKIDDSKKELSILGKLVADSGTFAGYEPR